MRSLFVLLLLVSSLAAQNYTYPGSYPISVPPLGTFNIPFINLQDAINRTGNGGSIRVLSGTYSELIDFGGREIRIFADVPGQAIFDGSGTETVLRFSGTESPGALVEGLVLRNGQGGVGWAGGVQCNGASPTLRSCRIESNQGGPADASNIGGAGGLQSDGGSPLIVDCVIEGNIGGPGRAGGLDLRGGSPLVRRCVVASNSGGRANTAPVSFGGAGGISAINTDGFTLEDSEVFANTGGSAVSTFTFNTATGAVGGGVGGIRLACAPVSQNLIRHSIIRGNLGAAARSGVLSSQGGAPGGMLVSGDGLLMEQVFVVENRGGAAVGHIVNPARGGTGAIEFISGVAANVVLRHCSIAGNSGGSSPSCLFGTCPGGPGALVVNGSPVFDHVIVQGNTSTPGFGTALYSQFVVAASATPDVRWSNIDTLPPGPGNIDCPSVFADPVNGDYHLALSSPDINAGDPQASFMGTDFDGDARVFYGVSDIGADELTTAPFFLDGSGEGLTMLIDERAWNFHSADAGDALSLRVEGSSWSASDLLIGFELFNGPGISYSFGALPSLHLNPNAAGTGIFVGPHPFFGFPQVGSGFATTLTLPLALAGSTLRLQALALSFNAANGFFATTPAHDIAVN